MKNTILAAGLGIALLFSGSVVAQQNTGGTGLGITRLVITKRQIAFGGASFGSAGPYEVLGGTAYGELDSRAPTNTGIVNLSHAPRNSRDHVEYSMEFLILKPVD